MYIAGIVHLNYKSHSEPGCCTWSTSSVLDQSSNYPDTYYNYHLRCIPDSYQDMANIP